MKSTFSFSTTFNTKYNHELWYLDIGKIKYFPDIPNTASLAKI